jgi:hypothetical protein
VGRDWKGEQANCSGAEMGEFSELLAELWGQGRTETLLVRV